MTRLTRSAARAAAAAVALFIPACSGGTGIPMQKTYKVTGRVLLDGRPVDKIHVRFIPKNGAEFKLGETPQATTDAEGRFALSTYNSGDGAPAGDYLVAVADPDQQPEASESDDTYPAGLKKAAPRVPPVYQTPQKSGLTATVPAQATELPPLELTATAK